MASQSLLFSRSSLLLPLRFPRNAALAGVPATPTRFLASRRVLLGAGVRPVKALRAVMLFAQDPLAHDVCAFGAGDGGRPGASPVLGGDGQAPGIRAETEPQASAYQHWVGFHAFLAFISGNFSGSLAPFLAALAPGINIFRMLFLGLGIWKNEAMVKSVSRHGDYRELLKGPLYYACTITLATSIFWRTSPIAIAAICNLCAGMVRIADIVGRRFGSQKLPYNKNKSFAGSIAMVVAGFTASVAYMHYYSMFGFMDVNWSLIIGFLVVSMTASLVESLPISSELDDNLTVPLTSLLVGSLVF
ncbi:putative phytol/farnesol kinase [Dioscorea sansibarensis]